MGRERVRLAELWHPFPRQVEATGRADEHQFTLYGGYRGPGQIILAAMVPAAGVAEAGEARDLRGEGGVVLRDVSDVDGSAGGADPA